MVICVSADHKNPVWKLFKFFPSWNCFERLQTTLPYGSLAYGLMHATLMFLRRHCPPLPWRDQQCCRDVFAIGCSLTSCTFSSSTLQLSPVVHRRISLVVTLPASWWTLPASLGTGSSIHTETSVLSPIPSHTIVFSSLSKNFHGKHLETNKMHTLLQLESFASFLCCEPKLFGCLIFSSSFFSLSTPLGVLEWETFMFWVVFFLTSFIF